MSIVLHNAILVDLDPPGVESGGLYIEGERIVARGSVTSLAADESIDCGGAVVLPGLVNGHTHLYSALAVGMPPPPRVPRNFLEILQLVWWRLDAALDGESIEASAGIGALESLRCGTTTLIDHHASPNCVAGSLDLVERGLSTVGLRGVLCYETTDRHGHAGALAGVEENRRYIERCRRRQDGRFAGLVGAHASFTLNDDTLDAIAALSEESGVGVHIHVAEDGCDEEACRREHGLALMERLDRRGVLRPSAIFAHGIHLDAAAIARMNEVGPHLAHNPRSNMNNAVGYAPVARFRCPIMLGTDGIGGDLFAEARHAWFKSRDAHGGLAPGDVVAMLATSACRASESLGVALGRLSPGAAADVVITDHVPATPLSADNLAAHLIFSIGSPSVRHVLIAGQWALRDRTAVACDERAIRRDARSIAQRLWSRL